MRRRFHGYDLRILGEICATGADANRDRRVSGRMQRGEYHAGGQEVRNGVPWVQKGTGTAS